MRLRTILVLLIATWCTQAFASFLPPRLRLFVSGSPAIYAGANNSDPQRIFYTIAHLSAPPFLLSVDSGSRWPWIYVDGPQQCFDYSQPMLNHSDASFEYGAGVFSANASVSTNSGYYSASFAFVSAAPHAPPVAVSLSSFVGVNQVAVNTPVLETLQSGIMGIGPPCFAANDTDQPCYPFFLGQVQQSLGFNESIVDFAISVPRLANSSSSLASGVLTFGALSNPRSSYAWQPLTPAARAQGLWYIEAEYSIGNTSSFTRCDIALVDTGGGPTQLPSAILYHFNRNCTGVESLPSYRIRMPASGAVFTMQPQDYVLRFYNETTSSIQCESTVLFASSIEGDAPTPAAKDTTWTTRSFCVIGMWTATKFALAFAWDEPRIGMSFRPT